MSVHSRFNAVRKSQAATGELDSDDSEDDGPRSGGDGGDGGDGGGGGGALSTESAMTHVSGAVQPYAVPTAAATAASSKSAVSTSEVALSPSVCTTT